MFFRRFNKYNIDYGHGILGMRLPSDIPVISKGIHDECLLISKNAIGTTNLRTRARLKGKFFRPVF